MDDVKESQEQKLPPLPEPLATFGGVGSTTFTADQMRTYALAAVELNRAVLAQEGEAVLPNGWIPLTIAFGGDAEEVAYGSPEQMARLKKWLDKYYSYVLAEKSAPQAPQSSPVVPEGWNDAIEALKYYAEGHHFIRHVPEAWDTVSGEPINFQEDEEGTATVEDGSIAKLALERLAAAPSAPVETREQIQDAAIEGCALYLDMLSYHAIANEIRSKKSKPAGDRDE